MGTGRTPAEPLARSFTSSPGPQRKKGLMMPSPPSLTYSDCVATLRPPTAQTPKADNILKTKGRERDFSPAKAENMLKESRLREIVRTPKQPDKMTARRDSPGPMAGGGKGLIWLDAWAS